MKNLLLAIIIKIIIMVLLAFDMVRTAWRRWREKRKPQKKLAWYATWGWGIIEDGYVIVEGPEEAKAKPRKED